MLAGQNKAMGCVGGSHWRGRRGMGWTVCVWGPLGSQISVQDTKPSEEWVQDPAERGDEAWVAGD